MSGSCVSDFRIDLEKSLSEDASPVERHLAVLYPGLVLNGSTIDDDRRGVDYWGLWKLDRPIAIDVKFRSRDYRHMGRNDLALEIWSRDNTSVGWARDRSKITDRVAFLHTDTGRVVSIPFRPMVECTIDHWKEWSSCFRVIEQLNRGYVSECVILPLGVLHAAMEPYLRRRSGMELPEGFKFCRHPDCNQTALYPCDRPAWCYRHHAAITDWVEPNSMRERREAMEALNGSINAARYDARMEKQKTKAQAKRVDDEFARLMANVRKKSK